MQHLAIHHKVSMQSSQVSPYAPEWSAQLSQPFVAMLHHSRRKGVPSMESRARSIVFWPGISTAIQETRDRCRSCNKTAPSQAATPPAALDTPSTPFESVFADFCDYGGCHYLVVGDRLSGWVDIYKTPPGTPYSGATGLIACLRQMFATFGVPEILSSDGALNSQLPKPPTSCRDGGSTIAYLRSPFRSLTAGLK